MSGPESREWKNATLLQSLAAEFLGTLFLVLTVVLSGGDAVNQYIAIGFVLMVQVYAFGHISGAHFNPAVTATFGLLRKLPPVTALLYIAVQVLGGLTGALVAYAVAGPEDIVPFTPLPSLADPVLSAFFAEYAYSTALCVVVASVATAHADDPNSHYALSIGFTLLSAVSAVGPISGAVINPAVGSAVDLVSTSAEGHPKFTWVYWAAPLLGSCTAAALYGSLSWLRASEAEVAAQATSPTASDSTSLAYDLPARVVIFEFVERFCGGDFNPAVTLGALLRYSVTRAELWKSVVVMLSQTAAGVLAGFSAFAIAGDVGWPHPDGANGDYGAFVYEMMWTGLLVTVVLNTTTPVFAGASQHVGELYRARGSTHGIAIGMTVAVGIIGAGKHGSGSGGVFNPAVGTGLSIAALAREHDSASALWVYWLAPLAGAVAAAGVFKLLHMGNTADDDGDIVGGASAGGGAGGERGADSLSGGYVPATTAPAAARGAALAGAAAGATVGAAGSSATTPLLMITGGELGPQFVAAGSVNSSPADSVGSGPGAAAGAGRLQGKATGDDEVASYLSA
ncbi:hypothetical protein FNF31_07011 [Cafeteria roenbergensis]|uniref:Aquaporin n=1 Tax=Cafeteria roenbergensis TaxID=33653 RepID=A0A5A8CD04_CAFRO|nr:hypothetical protein FNF31_07011 [Cafeteria roenbergensis]